MTQYTFENITDIIESCSDNPDFCDRYAVNFDDGSCLTMSPNPTHPAGVSMWSQGASTNNPVEFSQLPAHIQQHVVDRVNEL